MFNPKLYKNWGFLFNAWRVTCLAIHCVPIGVLNHSFILSLSVCLLSLATVIPPLAKTSSETGVAWLIVPSKKVGLAWTSVTSNSTLLPNKGPYPPVVLGR